MVDGDVDEDDGEVLVKVRVDLTSIKSKMQFCSKQLNYFLQGGIAREDE